MGKLPWVTEEKKWFRKRERWDEGRNRRTNPKNGRGGKMTRVEMQDWASGPSCSPLNYRGPPNTDFHLRNARLTHCTVSCLVICTGCSMTWGTYCPSSVPTESESLWITHAPFCQISHIPWLETTQATVGFSWCLEDNDSQWDGPETTVNFSKLPGWVLWPHASLKHMNSVTRLWGRSTPKSFDQGISRSKGTDLP